jgi:hypothetical protein
MKTKLKTAPAVHSSDLLARGWCVVMEDGSVEWQPVRQCAIEKTVDMAESLAYDTEPFRSLPNTRWKTLRRKLGWKCVRANVVMANYYWLGKNSY